MLGQQTEKCPIFLPSTSGSNLAHSSEHDGPWPEDVLSPPELLSPLCGGVRPALYKKFYSERMPANLQSYSGAARVSVMKGIESPSKTAIATADERIALASTKIKMTIIIYLENAHSDALQEVMISICFPVRRNQSNKVVLTTLEWAKDNEGIIG